MILDIIVPMNYPSFIQDLQVKFCLPPLKEVTMSAFQNQLSHHINFLLKKDLNRLVQLLYMVDVDERIVNRVLNKDSLKAGSLLADAIIDRQVWKLQYRYSVKKDTRYSEEELW